MVIYQQITILKLIIKNTQLQFSFLNEVSTFFVIRYIVGNIFRVPLKNVCIVSMPLLLRWNCFKEKKNAIITHIFKFI